MPNEEQADLEATLRRLGQQSWHRVTTHGGLEREIESLVDRALQQSAALTPGRRVGLFLAETEVGRHDRPGGPVGVVVLTDLVADGGTDTLLSKRR